MSTKNLQTKVKSKKGFTKNKMIASIILGLATLALVIFAVISIIYELGPIKPIKSSKQELKVVGECADFEVKYEEIRYLTLLYRAELDQKLGEYGTLSDVGKAEYEKELYSYVEKNVKKTYSVLSLCADFGIDIYSKEANAYVNGEIESIVKQGFDGSKKSYRSWLEENNLTDSFLRLLYRLDFLEDEIVKYLTDNKIGIEFDSLSKDKFVDYVMSTDDYVRTVHCYYPKESIYFDTSDYAQRAENLSSELLNEPDFEKRYSLLSSAIGNAPFVPGISMTNDGIYFTYGQMGELYEEAAFALEEYGVSLPVEADDGYYVIMRLPLDRDYVSKNAGDLLNKYGYTVLKKKLDEKQDQIKFITNEYFETLDLVEID